MGRSFAEILAMISFATVTCRGIIAGNDVASTMKFAVLGLVVMAIVGALVGSIAAWVVEDSVRYRMTSQLATQKENKSIARENR